VETLTEAGFRLEKLTYDLHNSEHEAENLHTEYEDNFSAKGFTINRVEAYVN
jgi:tRNA (guanine-N7-)-methyltransferase